MNPNTLLGFALLAYIIGVIVINVIEKRSLNKKYYGRDRRRIEEKKMQQGKND